MKFAGLSRKMLEGWQVSDMACAPTKKRAIVDSWIELELVRTILAWHSEGKTTQKNNVARATRSHTLEV